MNLRIGERDLAVTHCPLTGSSLVFDRAAIGGAELGVSGLLFKNNAGAAPAWIETVASADAEGTLAEVYGRIAGRSGSVAHVLRCQSLHPEALRDHHGLYRTIMFDRGALSRAERESIAVVVSAVNGCRY